MNYRTVTVLLILGLLIVFAGLNWELFNTPSTINLLFTQVEAPLGMTLLGVIGGLTLLYLMFAIGVEAAALMEVRRYARELHAARKLLENEEASRFTKLRQYLQAELEALKEEHAKTREHTRTLAEQLEEALKAEARQLRTEIEQTEAVLGSAIERLEGRLGQAEAQINQVIERTGNTLAAYIGEIEDRVLGGAAAPEEEARPDTTP